MLTPGDLVVFKDGMALVHEVQFVTATTFRWPRRPAQARSQTSKSAKRGEPAIIVSCIPDLEYVKWIADQRHDPSPIAFYLTPYAVGWNTILPSYFSEIVPP